MTDEVVGSSYLYFELDDGYADRSSSHFSSVENITA